MPGTRKLGRTSDSRNAMMRAMVTYLLENGKIETTVTRAKDVRSMAEKMISLGKASDLHTKRQVYAYITKEDVAKKLFDEISPKYADRNGGYTRIIKTGFRASDASEMCFIELVDFDENMAKTKKKATRTRRSKKAAATAEAPATAEATEAPAEEAKAE